MEVLGRRIDFESFTKQSGRSFWFLALIMKDLKLLRLHHQQAAGIRVGEPRNDRT